jgi:hypothetical protein
MANSGPNTNGSSRPPPFDHSTWLGQASTLRTYRKVLTDAHAPSIIILVLFRLAILSDAGTDTVLGHQAHDIRSRELGDARFAALGGSRRRRSGSVCNAHFSLVFLLSFVPENSTNQLNTLSAMTGHAKTSRSTKLERFRHR